MASVSYLRAADGGGPVGRRHGRPGAWRGRRRPGRWLAGGAGLAAIAVVAAAAVALGTARAHLTAAPGAIAHVQMPFGGGTIARLSVVTGPHSQPVPARVADGLVYPDGPVAAGARLQVQVVVRRPGWISWLSGSTQRLVLNVTTPAASLTSHYVTLTRSGDLVLRFRAPVAVYAFGPSRAAMTRRELVAPSATITLPHRGPAGTMLVSAAPLSWEQGRAVAISWFPPGSAATAVSSPSPGTTIGPATPITLTFSKPYEQVLHGHLPPVSPITPGTWHRLNSHAIRFEPEGYGYGLGAQVQIALPSGVRLAGARAGGGATTGTWSVPAGSTLRLQQLLATLGYLPLRFTYAGGRSVPLTPQAQEAAATSPPAGRFSLRWPDIPAWFRAAWAPGDYGELTKAAVMAFENDSGLTADGIAGPAVWRALIAAVIHGRYNTFGYTIADVSEASPESLTLWHNGRVILTTPVNTGIPQAPTALGTYAVYEHLPVTTMSGTNPNGTHYSDPGIPWVSYFNGGDALHGFLRAQYGFPQSLGCVEMPYATAGRVYPYTPIGTIVHVS